MYTQNEVLEELFELQSLMVEFYRDLFLKNQCNSLEIATFKKNIL